MFDGDGYLFARDLDAWRNAFRRGDPRADQNQDGFVTASDFTAWIANYNKGCF